MRLPIHVYCIHGSIMQTFFSYSGFVMFVLTLKKDFYQIQFGMVSAYLYTMFCVCTKLFGIMCVVLHID